MFLFGYGSLMNVESAKETLWRDLSLSDLLPTFIKGYKRTWSLKENVFAEAFGKGITAIFLDIDKSDDAITNGVLIAIDQAELERMKIREKSYDCVEVTPRVFTFSTDPPPPGEVFTFISKIENRVQKEDKELYVLRQYIQKVENACISLGEDFFRLYQETTEEPKFEVVDGAYTFPDLP